jgi:nucleotide-binding universal stress UspA family protein
VQYEHVLAVTDGSPEADRAVKAASRLAGQHGARLTLAAVVELGRENHHCGIGTTIWNEVLRDAAQADLDRARRMVEMPAGQEILVRPGARGSRRRRPCTRLRRDRGSGTASRDGEVAAPRPHVQAPLTLTV